MHLVDELVKTLPEGVYYTKVTQKGSRLSLDGVAQSNARVSSLMRQLDSSDWMQEPSLVEIKRERADASTPDDVRLSAFTLKMKQTLKNQDEEEEEGDS